MKNLDSLNRSHIDFLKSIKKPLPSIKALFEGLCVLFKIQEIPFKKSTKKNQKQELDFSKAARAMMAKPEKMLLDLKSFNEEKISTFGQEGIEKLKSLFKHKDFDLGQMGKTSLEAEKLATFLVNFVGIFE